MLSTGLKNKVTYESFERNQAKNTVYVIDKLSAEQTSSTAEVRSSVTIMDKKTQAKKMKNITLKMKKEGTEWKIDTNEL